MICVVRNLSLGFPTRSGANQAVQAQKIAKDLESKGIVLLYSGNKDTLVFEYV